MAIRDITGKLLRVCFGKVGKDATPSRILDAVCDAMAFVQKDLDKTCDVEEHCYYEGMIDAYNHIAHMIAPFKNDAANDKYNALLGFMSLEETRAALENVKEIAA